MAILKPFKGYRPQKQFAANLACRPYDVLSSDEARVEAQGNPLSFLHVVKSEIDLSPEIDIHTEVVYRKAKENLNAWIADKIFIQDEEAYFYIYAQTLWGRTQYGLVASASIEDYANNIIRKHELTRPDKEEDRINHIRVTNFNAEPVFFAYPDHAEINSIVAEIVAQPAEYDFITGDGIGHQLWVVREQAKIQRITEIFNTEIPYTYIADGHHRTASAARVGEERKKQTPQHNGTEEYNYFMAVHFPASQLAILDYNRLVKDLNGKTTSEFLSELEKRFDMEIMGTEPYKPKVLHNFSMYLEGKWYSLTAKPGTFNDNDPIDVLDVTILTNLVLEPLLNITDLRRSTRIDFVGGMRGLGELKRRVDNGEMAAAFALYPVSLQQLFDIADSGNIMPPKTTWFEPKLRSGLVLHCLD